MPIKRSSPGDFWVVVGLTLMLALPAWLAVRPAQTMRPLIPLEGNPTPLGYTWSLLLFVVPNLVIGWKVLSLKECAIEQKAFGLSLLLLLPTGFLLDIFFGMTFFTFENRQATLGWNLPGYIRGQGFARVIPVEEFAFYGLGFIAILLLYVWADNVWLKAYNVGASTRVASSRWRERLPRPMRSLHEVVLREINKFLAFPLSPLLIGTPLFLLAWLIKNKGPIDYNEGIPGYFLYLLLASIIPSCLCFRIAARLINWRAFGFSFFFILLISLFWEATLGIPYQWWGYQKEQMMGIFFKPFCDLPMEAVLVWAAAVWTTVLIYETIHFALWAGVKPFWKILFLRNHQLEKLARDG